MCYIKTILNSWTTTSRFGAEVIWPCIFGCGCTGNRDSVRHYLHCPELRLCLGKAYGCETSGDLAIFGLDSGPSEIHVERVASTFIAYHSVVKGHAGLVHAALRTQSHIEVRRAFTECIVAARSELAPSRCRRGPAIRRVPAPPPDA